MNSLHAAPSGPAFVWAAPSAADQPLAPAARPSVERTARAHLASAASGHRYAAERVAELELRSVHDTGKGAIILPHGVLFRGNVESAIREKIKRELARVTG